MNISEKVFKDLLSRFILTYEDDFYLYFNDHKEGHDETLRRACNNLYDFLTELFGDMAFGELDPYYFNVNNISVASYAIMNYRSDIFKTMQSIVINKPHVEIIDTLRESTSFSDVINYTSRFAEFYNEYCDPAFSREVNTTGNEGVFTFLYIFYLSTYGAFALNDELYNELSVNKKNFERPRFDYLRNGKPLRWLPYLYTSKEEPRVFNPDNIDSRMDFLIQIELFYKELGYIPSHTRVDSDFILLAKGFSEQTLGYTSLVLKKDKFKFTVYNFIDMLESVVLAQADNGLNINEEQYVKLGEFNSRYAKEVEKCITIEDVDLLLEKYKDIYDETTAAIRDRISFYMIDTVRGVGFFDIDEMAENPKFPLYLSKQEYLVILGHLKKLKVMFMEFATDNINYILPEIFFLFTSTENKLREIEEQLRESNTTPNTKKVNKKISKYKRAFKFKDINSMAEKAGFTKVRQKGDHGVFKKLDGTTVVIPQGRDIGKGLSIKIQKEIIESMEETTNA